MTVKNTLVSVVVVVVLLIGIAAGITAVCDDDWCNWFPWQKTKTVEPVVISDFEECIAAGYPVMESFPRQCRVGNKTFAEHVPIEQLPPAQYEDENVRLDTPFPDSVVASPLKVSGLARGTWFFEASFPVKLVDEVGNLIVQGHAQADGEWMTENFVPFQATLNFSAPTVATGYLVLEKDNPSGLVENAEEIRIKVRFK